MEVFSIGDGLSLFAQEVNNSFSEVFKKFFSGMAYAVTEKSTVPWRWALGVLSGLFVLNLLFCYFTRAGVIARATTKEALRQPIYILLLVMVAVFLVANVFLPFFSLGEDMKMYKDVCLITLMTSGMFLAIWTASTSIADEIEGKTAMTLLSKPINRPSFILGKYVGIMNLVLALLVPLIIVFLLCIFYKVGYDGKEQSQVFTPKVLDETRLKEALLVMPALLLIFMEICVMAALSVAISTRLPMIVNVVTCFAVFVVGHLTPVLVKTVFKDLEFVRFMAQLIATFLPSLEVFSPQAAIATGREIPAVYVGLTALYTAAYCAAAVLLSFLLFEDRDLA